MSQFDELLKAIPVSQLAQQVGADESQVSAAVQQVLPALVGGLSANARQPEGAAALTNALADHGGLDLSDIANVDTDDGAKIVSHIFGNQSETVVNQLGGLGGGAGGGLIKKLLPILAPIVLSFLAKKLSSGGGLGGAMGDILGGGGGGGQTQAPVPSGNAPGDTLPADKGAPSTTAQPTPTQAPVGQGGVGDILGDLLGGAIGGKPAQGGAGGFGLDDILGGLLGGKR